MIQNFISKLSPKEKKIFYIAVGFVLLALLDRLFLGPTMSKLKSLDEDITQQENVIKSNLRFLSYKDKILKENTDLSAYYAQKAQTEEEIIAFFLKKIEMLATESKVNLAKVTPADSKQKKGFVEYYANLECDGKLEDVTKFMYAIDASPDLLKVVKLSLNPKKAGSDEVIAAMTVTKVIIDASSIDEAEKLSKEFDSKGGGNITGEVDGNKIGGANKESAAVSERFAPKAVKSKEPNKDQQPAGEENEIKPSVWEKMMQKKGVQNSEGTEEAAPTE